MTLRTIERLGVGLVLAAIVTGTPVVRAAAVMDQTGMQQTRSFARATGEEYLRRDYIYDSRTREAGVAFVVADPETARCVVWGFYLICASACLADGVIIGVAVGALVQRWKQKKGGAKKATRVGRSTVS